MTLKEFQDLMQPICQEQEGVDPLWLGLSYCETNRSFVKITSLPCMVASALDTESGSTSSFIPVGSRRHLHERSRKFSQQSWFLPRLMFPKKSLFKLPVCSFPGGRPNSYAIGSSPEVSVLPPDGMNYICFCFCIADSEAEYPQDPSRYKWVSV